MCHVMVLQRSVYGFVAVALVGQSLIVDKATKQYNMEDYQP